MAGRPKMGRSSFKSDSKASLSCCHRQPFDTGSVRAPLSIPAVSSSGNSHFPNPLYFSLSTVSEHDGTQCPEIRTVVRYLYINT